VNKTDPQSVCSVQVDRRGEVRKPAFGTIRLLRENGGEAVVATLVNSSRHGFRIRVEPGLTKVGDRVRLQYPWGEIVATIMWQDSGEAGLFVP
jgi:hypothetical protein